MDNLEALVSLVVYFFVFVWLFHLFSGIVKLIIKREPFKITDLLIVSETIKQKPVVSSLVAIGVLAIILFSNSTFNELIGYDKPLSERDAGDYCYYVEATDDAGNKYTVPAKISVDKWLEDDGNGGSDGVIEYDLKQLIFDDGTVINNEDGRDASFKHANHFYDTEGNEWECRLTEKHAYSNSVQETSFVNPRSVIELGVVVAVILINWLGGLAMAVQENKKEKLV